MHQGILPQEIHQAIGTATEHGIASSILMWLFATRQRLHVEKSKSVSGFADSYNAQLEIVIYRAAVS